MINVREPAKAKSATRELSARVRGTVTGAVQLWLGSRRLAIGEGGAFDEEVSLEEGENRWLLVASDRAGNQSEKALRVTRDTTPPRLLKALAPVSGRSRGRRRSV